MPSSGKSVHPYRKVENPCLADVCKVLNLQPNKVKARLSMRGWNTIPTPTYNQHGAMVEQQMTFITEPNLYKCIFQSRKKEAEAFQDWVCSEVLPSIRTNGGYMVPVRTRPQSRSWRVR